MTTKVTLEIPDAILKGIESGELFRWGGVIRDAGGQFVTFLADASAGGAETRAAQGLAARLTDRAAAALKPGSSKEALVLAGSAVVAVSAVAGTLVLVSKIRSGKSAVPERVAAYNDSLVSYLKAANMGVLDAHGVGRLLADLDAVVSHVDAGGRRIKVDFTAKRSKTLHSLVLAYTVQLAEARGLDAELLLDFEATKPRISERDTVEELRRHLVVQERILRETS